MVEHKNDKEQIALPQVLDIYVIQTLFKNLVNTCDNRSTVLLDARNVKKITSSEIQLIVYLFKTFTKNAKQLIVDNISPDMKEALDDFGLLELVKNGAKL